MNIIIKILLTIAYIDDPIAWSIISFMWKEKK